jgi:SAM-dependent MidA family methyltransferase
VRAVGSLIDVIRERGPLTVAAFMDLALYHPTFGYYTRAAQRSGRAGDFFTSVDVGPLFGELLAIQFAEMFELLPGGSGSSSRDELVEAGAGNGRLALDVLRGFERHAPRTLARVGLSLVESSAAARAEHTKILEPYAGHLKSSAAELPDEITGILYANEILDAFPVHQVVMRADGLKEMYVEDHGGVLMTREGPLSDDRLARHFDGLDVTLAPGWIAEVSLAAIDWVRGAARRLRQGFLVFVDYVPPCARVVFRDAFAGHADLIHATSRRRARYERPSPLAQPARRTRHHRARGFHEHPARRRIRRHDDDCAHGSDVLCDGDHGCSRCSRCSRCSGCAKC